MDNTHRRRFSIWPISPRLVLLLGIFQLLGACSRFKTPVPLIPTPGFDAARGLSWGFYALPGPPFPMHVLTGPQLTCRNSPGDKMIGFNCDGAPDHQCTPESPCPCTCLAGVTAGAYQAIAWDGIEPWHETAICHEDGHVYSGLHFPQLGGDPGHKNPAVWGPGGAVEKCVAELTRRGY